MSSSSSSFVDYILLLEVAVIAGVIFAVPYTEIDWRAYMEEVGGFMRGQLDYAKLQGGTGPLVYPGGFVWLYSALYYITKGGVDVELAQWIFAAVYWSVLALALSLYYRSGHRSPGRSFVPLLISKRIRSIHVLRLFNDTWAVLFAYLAISVLARRRGTLRWFLGCVLFSIAVSVKMNILLFAPGLFYVMVRSLPWHRVLYLLSVCAAVQLVAGYPFLLYRPWSYMGRAFELGRVFNQRWSVNLQFLPRELFEDVRLGQGLLAGTLVGWALLWYFRWRHRTFVYPAKGAAKKSRRASSTAPEHVDFDEKDEDAAVARTGGSVGGGAEDDADQDQVVFHAVVLTLMESNLLGVILARSLHYQFYAWFFFSVPYVLYYTKLPQLAALGAFALVRQGFEGYPPTPQSSALLMGGFALMLISMLFLGCDEGRDAYMERRKAIKEAAKAKPATRDTSKTKSLPATQSK